MSSASKKSETLTILFSMKVSVVYRNSKVTASLFILVVTFWSLYCSKDQQQYPSDKSPGFGYGEWFMRSVALLTLCTTVIIWWKHFSCTKYSSLDGEIVLSSSNKVSSQKKNKNNIESQLNFDFPWMFNFYKDTKEGDAARIRIMKMVKVGCS